MTADPSSLDRLRDIVQPVPISWWPPAAGWWVLLGMVTTGAAVYTIQAIRQWRSNEYRRTAVREVEGAIGCAAISEILKRTALAAFPRDEVAAMSGARWCRWLGDTSGITVPPEVLDVLTTGVYSPQTSDGETDLRRFALAWIRQHRQPGNPRGRTA
ncbi:DUF4381 domain-containing protein [Stieleria mannarensis]|uniref:DUF4381 domain-containing protein n=1 Tax=Stieleria mannarensis TaxID=2755585 RepID=UPI0016002D4F|nr:DUF4381 domain-containing protein [Rhodopirellula sp. JC639]